MRIGRLENAVVSVALLLAFACSGGVGTDSNMDQVQPSTMPGDEAMGMMLPVTEMAPVATPGQTTPGQTMPGQTMPGQTMPGQDETTTPAGTTPETPLSNGAGLPAGPALEGPVEPDPTTLTPEPMMEPDEGALGSEIQDEMTMMPEPEEEATEPEVEEMEPEAESPLEDEEGEEGDEPLEGEEGVPMTDHCAAVAEWEPEWLQWEQEVLLLVNEARSAARSCGTQGDFEATEPLTMNAALTCAARLHSLDMFERDFFDHANPDGVQPSTRVTDAGYEWSTTGENIAYGYPSPEAVMEGWLDSDGHCSNIMSDNYTEIGVGYYPGETGQRFASNAHFWTQNFGAPPGQFGGGGFGGGGGGFGMQ